MATRRGGVSSGPIVCFGRTSRRAASIGCGRAVMLTARVGPRGNDEGQFPRQDATTHTDDHPAARVFHPLERALVHAANGPSPPRHVPFPIQPVQAMVVERLHGAVLAGCRQHRRAPRAKDALGLEHQVEMARPGRARWHLVPQDHESGHEGGLVARRVQYGVTSTATIIRCFPPPMQTPLIGQTSE